MLVYSIQNEDELDTVSEAAQEHWDFEGGQWALDEDIAVSPYEQGSLYGGVSEEEFSDRVAKAIWKALGRYARVEIEMTYLEDLPREIHVRDNVLYEKLKSAGVLNE